MKRIFTILLALHILVSGFLPEQSIAELNKIPSLVQHYYHHLSEHNEPITFTEFIAMHYGDSKHTEEEDHDDLPFFDSVCMCILFVHSEIQHYRFDQNFEEAVIHSAITNNYNLIHNSVIFQPPRA